MVVPSLLFDDELLHLGVRFALWHHAGFVELFGVLVELFVQGVRELDRRGFGVVGFGGEPAIDCLFLFPLEVLHVELEGGVGGLN